jgi:nucleotide-binding universal stress UspA family protein
MAYKTLLLCLNETQRLKQLITVGRELGAKFNAHVSGLYIIPGVEVYPVGGFADLPNINDGNRKHYEAKLKSVREAFEDAMKDDGLAFDFRLVDSERPTIASEQILHSHAADLVIMSSVDTAAVYGADVDAVERMVMGAGRPVLVLPHKGDIKLDWNEALVGWNDSREAAHAVFGAVPYLQKFKTVRIVSIDTATPGKVPGAVIAEALSRHGIKVEVSTMHSDGMNTGEALQRAANDYGSGVVVLGAYGHNRVMEFVFGGATRHMLKNVTRPLFMAH